MTTTTHGETIGLPDGRRVGVARHGVVAGGLPVIVAHGTPASRLGHEFLHAAAVERSVSIICVDRPGHGLSDPKPDRTIGGWAADAAGVADALGIDRFAVLGYSGGGPYAIAAAAGLPERVLTAATMAGVCSLDDELALDGMNPTDVKLIKLIRRHERAAWLALWVFANMAKRAPGFGLKQFAKEVSEPDRVVLFEAGPSGFSFVNEAFRQGVDGVLLDYRLCSQSWDFDPSRATCHVDIWQGDADRLVPVRHAEVVAGLIPDATVHVLPGVGHVSIQRQTDKILDGIVAASARV